MNPEIRLRKRWLVYGFGLFILTLIQLKGSLRPTWTLPDFLLLLPLLAGLWTPGHDSFILGLATGFIRDYAAGRGYGTGMLLGMFLGLWASYLAREGWRAYAIRGGILVMAASLIQEGVLSFLSGLLPLSDLPVSLGQTLLLALGGLPVKLAANMAGALVMTALLALLFRDWKKGAGPLDFASSLKETDHA